MILKYLEDKFNFYETSNGNFRIMDLECPYCGKPEKVYFKPEYGQVYCFTCSQSYRAINFFADYEGMSSRDMYFFLKGGDRQSKYIMATKEQEVPGPVPPFFPEMTELPENARQYILDRGIPETLINRFQLKFCPQHSTFQGKVVYCGDRIIIPIFNRAGELVSWQGRDIVNGSPVKYLFSPDFKQSEHLYNGYSIKPGCEYLIVCEGVFDLFGWYQSGFKNVVATFGKKMSKAQMKLIIELNPGVLLFAWDHNCYKEMFKCSEVIGHRVKGISIVQLPSGKDADECNRAELVGAVSTSKKPSWKEMIYKGLGRGV